MEVVLIESLTMDSLDNGTSQFNEEIIEIVCSLDTLNHKVNIFNSVPILDTYNKLLPSTL